MTTISVDAAAYTHTGLVRSRNEDSHHVGRSLFAVADGMGGHVGGDVASTLAIEAMRHYDRPYEDSTDLPVTLGQAVHTANAALADTFETRIDLRGMGTTLVAVLRAGASAALASIGDSRAYVLHGDSPDARLIQITEDHVCGHLLADANRVPRLPARLARYLDGRADGRSPDIATWTLRSGDRFVLCSDGLSSVVEQDTIRAVLASPADSADAAEQLVAQAIERGGPDNVTALVLSISEQDGATALPAQAGVPMPDAPT